MIQHFLIVFRVLCESSDPLQCVCVCVCVCGRVHHEPLTNLVL